MPRVPDSGHADYLVSHFVNRTVPFKFRGRDFAFDLSQGLFSSAGVDAGTGLLLKVFSGLLDGDAKAGRPPPERVLDAGCGVGVLGICAAAALEKAGTAVRCQDRDELAGLFTLHNAAKNGVRLEARAEPLLAGLPDERWDLILTNIPAKAGLPVLKDFVRRSAGLLKPGGRVAMVAVNTLADFFAEQIALAGAEPLLRQDGSGHAVFVYGAGPHPEKPVLAGPGFLSGHPFYVRVGIDGKIGGICVRAETVHGASGFDGAGDAAELAAGLALRLGREKFAPGPMLVHEPGQGFFPLWLAEFLRDPGETPRMVLSGRNVLALEAARHNVSRRFAGPDVVPAADLRLGGSALLGASDGKRYGCVAVFPEFLSQPKGADRFAALWAAVLPLIADGGIFLAAPGSSDAERLDRKKPAGFVRLGNLRRRGFRALAYRREG